MGVRVATIGAGYFSQFHHDGWTREPRAQLVAVCDEDRKKAEAFASTYAIPSVYDDAQQMLEAERPDLVDIIVPPAGHKALIELTAAAGIATICQKAFCRSLDEAREAVAIARDAGILLVVHENFRFAPWYREVRRLIDDGSLGTIYQATFLMRPGDGRGENAYLDRQPYFQTMERFLVHETAIHFIDTFRSLFGEPQTVYADLRRLNAALAGEDAGLILFEHEGGVRALFDGNRLADHVAENRRLTMGELLVECEAGTLRLDGDGALHMRRFGTNEETPHPYEWSRQGFSGDAVHALQSHVVAHLLDGAPLENAAADYLRNLEIEEAVYRSSETGRKLTL